MVSLSRQSTRLFNAYGTQLDGCSRPLRTFPARASVSPLLTARAFCCITRSIPLHGGPTCTVTLELTKRMLGRTRRVFADARTPWLLCSARIAARLNG